MKNEREINKENISKIRDGIYVGAACSIIMDEGWISIVVDDAQLKIFQKYKNYEFHFDKNGDYSGTGMGIASHFQNQGTIIGQYEEKPEESELELSTVNRITENDSRLPDSLESG